jgi:hypothetical protein
MCALVVRIPPAPWVGPVSVRQLGLPRVTRCEVGDVTALPLAQQGKALARQLTDTNWQEWLRLLWLGGGSGGDRHYRAVDPGVPAYI